MSNLADRTLLAILAALMAFGPLSIDMYLPTFASIAADFSVSTAQVELSLASFFIGLAAGQLLHGSLSDRFGRRPVVLFGLGIYVVACIACALAPSVDIWSVPASFRRWLHAPASSCRARWCATSSSHAKQHVSSRC